MRERGPEAWADRLAGPDVPAGVAAHFAQRGDTHQRSTLATNPASTLDVQTVLAEDEEDEVVQSLLFNWELPTEVVSRILDRFPQDEVARTHPQAPLRWKLRLPVFKLASYSLSLFLDSVRATEDERLQLHRISQRYDGTITLGYAWAQVRGHRWSPPGASDEARPQGERPSS